MTDRYDFGRNWQEFSATISPDSIDSSEQALGRLIGDASGKTFFDIGSGSGLHTLAALRLGVEKVVAIDYDPQSVETTRQVLSDHARAKNWTVYRDDILDLGNPPGETFDIVYSWGVLHHTGKMWTAIDNSIPLVNEGGLLVLALYRKTSLCGLWKQEKRLYSRVKFLRPIIRGPFVAALLIGHLFRGRNPFAVIKTYKMQRGMSLTHDADDWLGGYPYESVEPEELVAFMEGRDFQLVHCFNTRKHLGVFGAGCAEWVFRRCNGRPANSC